MRITAPFGYFYSLTKTGRPDDGTVNPGTSTAVGPKLESPWREYDYFFGIPRASWLTAIHNQEMTIGTKGNPDNKGIRRAMVRDEKNATGATSTFQVGSSNKKTCEYSAQLQ